MRVILALILIIFISGCILSEANKFSEIPIEDLEHATKKKSVCMDPYVVINETCCLDTNLNDICDTDEIKG